MAREKVELQRTAAMPVRIREVGTKSRRRKQAEFQKPNYRRMQKKSVSVLREDHFSEQWCTGARAVRFVLARAGVYVGVVEEGANFLIQGEHGNKNVSSSLVVLE